MQNHLDEVRCKLQYCLQPISFMCSSCQDAHRQISVLHLLSMPCGLGKPFSIHAAPLLLANQAPVGLSIVLVRGVVLCHGQFLQPHDPGVACQLPQAL